MSHLGDRVAALVDGQLGPDAVERAHVHLAGCRPCRDLVEVERLTKSRLATLQRPAPGVELLGRLYLLAGPDGPLPPREGRVPGTPRVRPVPLPPAPGRLPTGSLRPGRTRPPGRRSSRRTVTGARPRVRLAAAAAMLGALSLLGAGVLGTLSSEPRSPGTLTPPIDQIAVHPDQPGRTAPGPEVSPSRAGR